MRPIHEGTMPWHEGEITIHNILKIPDFPNPTSPFLFPSAGYLLYNAPLLALGTLDDDGRPWTTLWGGKTGFAKPLSASMMSIRAIVDRIYDPVSIVLFHGTDEQAVKEKDAQGKMISGLTFDLDSRQRIKLYGRMVTANLKVMEDAQDVCTIQLMVNIEQSLANCPKYMNCKHINPAVPTPRLISSSPELPDAALALLAKADLFFLSSSNRTSDMDTNIRGGPPGFFRVLSNDPDGAVLVWPEYSGNRLYQTLGNLQTTPLAGIVVPDFESGDVLYATGRTEIFIGNEAATLLPGSNLAIKITITAARFVEKGLSFRGVPGELSPYNPKIRYLSTEKVATVQQITYQKDVTASLVKKEIITPTIARFRFCVSDPVVAGTWKPGQFVTLSFEEELSEGYSHMRDDDPTSLNDDYLRTFTISSFPDGGNANTEFEITIRRVGKVTEHLFQSNARSGLTVPLLGYGGEFRFHDDNVGGLIPFIASGVGITPLLGQLPGIDTSRVRLFWTVNAKDVAFVSDTFSRFPELPKTSSVFITGTSGRISATNRRSLEQLAETGTRLERRRLQADDLHVSEAAKRWYICTGTELRTRILKWLAGEMVVYENFNY